MRKIKILYTVSSLANVGPIVQLMNVLKYIDTKKFDVYILTLSDDPAGSLLQDFKNMEVNIIECPVSRWDILNRRALSLIKEISPDIIHSSGIRADRLSSILEKKYITISTIHNFMFEDYKFTYGKVLGSMMIERHLKYIRKIKYPVTCSDSINKKYKDKGIHINISIPNGVDIDKFNVLGIEEKNSLKQSLGLSLEKTIFVSTGNLIKLKDPEIIIKSFINSEAYASSILMILGDGKLKSQLETEYKSHSNILFYGRVSNVVDYLQISDVFVSASHSEGLPNSLLEAMSCNLYLLLSDIPSHKQVYNIKNVCYEAFPVGNNNKLVECFGTVIRQYRKKQLLSNRKIVIKQFSAEEMSMKYQKLYLDNIRK